MIDKYELLELFESEPKMDYSEDVGIYTYKKTVNDTEYNI